MLIRINLRRMEKSIIIRIIIIIIIKIINIIIIIIIIIIAIIKYFFDIYINIKEFIQCHGWVDLKIRKISTPC